MSQKFVNQINNKNILFISNSKFIQDSIKQKFSKNSIVIYPPVELELFRNETKKENSVITVSRYPQEKNLDFAIDVFQDTDVKYTLIGNTKTRVNKLYYEKILSMVRNIKSKILLLKNVERSKVVENLQRSKVYFHASPETFGISVVESIAAGCIPIVPDNSAHKETVPIDELRYNPNNKKDAQEKVQKALAGDYDDLIKPLQNSLKYYDKRTFKDALLSFIQNIEN